MWNKFRTVQILTAGNLTACTNFFMHLYQSKERKRKKERHTSQIIKYLFFYLPPIFNRNQIRYKTRLKV